MLRFAPSPTGDMDINNLRIAIINYLVSQQRDEQFLVRIADLDSKRNIEGKDTEVMMLLEKFALKHNSVFHQTEHLNLHQTLALRLLKEEKAFICKCTDAELKLEKEIAEANNLPYHYSGPCENLEQEDYNLLKKSGEKFVIRIKKPNEDILFHDILKGEIATTPEEVDSFIILKSDNTPSHNFACPADDMMSNINFIINQDKYLRDMPKQIHIKKLLGYEEETKHLHLPTILNTNETSSLKWLFEEGFIPDAILNYLLLLGNEEIEEEIFTLPDAIKWFDINHISNSKLDFDLNKLQHINREHLKLMNDRELSTLFGFADADIGKLAKVYLNECSTINELKERIEPIFKAKDFTILEGGTMKIISDIIFQAPAIETFDKFKEHIINKSALKEEDLLQPLRYLLTGSQNGPELSEIYPYIKSYILEVAS